MHKIYVDRLIVCEHSPSGWRQHTLLPAAELAALLPEAPVEWQVLHTVSVRAQTSEVKQVQSQQGGPPAATPNTSQQPPPMIMGKPNSE